MLTIDEFCRKHHACSQGHRWAVNNCSSMQEVWEKCDRTDWLYWIATRPGVFDDKTLRLFAVFCCRQVQHLMKDERSINAVDVAERFADDLATKEELAVARVAADAAANAYAAYAAYAAAYAAADADDAYAYAYAYAYAANAAKSYKSNVTNYLHNLKPNFEL